MATMAITAYSVLHLLQTDNHDGREPSVVNAGPSNGSGVIAAQNKRRDLQNSQCCECDILTDDTIEIAPGFCFPESVMVQVKRNDNDETSRAVPMKDLKVGDRVLVDSNGRYERIYAFGHRSPAASPNHGFVQFSFSEKTDKLTLSLDHMVKRANSQSSAPSFYSFVSASQIRVGDKLHIGDHGDRDGRGENIPRTVTVDRIRLNIGGRGLYAPFTPLGTIVVNGVVVSCYTDLMFGNDLPLPVSIQWASHQFLLPYRLLCHCWYGSFQSICSNEKYNNHGINAWLETPLELVNSTVQQHWLVRFVALTIFFTVLALFWILEIALNEYPSIVATGGCIVLSTMMIVTMTKSCFNRKTQKEEKA